MNIFFMFKDALVTPALNGSILPGITRDSVLKMAKEMGLKCEERRVSIQEVYEAHAKGELLEVFGSGTAAVISPVGELNWAGNIININDGKTGPVAAELYDRLTAIQYGRGNDVFGWGSIVSE
jgi:branched-chain amino acid aminotransferase